MTTVNCRNSKTEIQSKIIDIKTYFVIKQIFLHCYNRFHNILGLFDILPNFSFTTSETMCYYYLQTWYTQIALRFAERLRAFSLLGEPPKEKFCCYQQKMLEKQNLNPSIALSHTKTRIGFKYHVNDCLWKQFFPSNSPPNPFKLNFFENFGNSNAFHTALT